MLFMASSMPKSINLSQEDLSQAVSVALTEKYFCIVYEKYGIPIPEGASWDKWDEYSSLNGHTKIFQEVPTMLFEIADLFEDARVEVLVKKCERLRLNSGNLHAQFISTITTLLDNEITWGKIIVFFAFAVSFAIYLCTNEMSHLAARVCVWAAQVLQDRLQPWMDENGGWESLLRYGREALSHKNEEAKKAEAMKTFGQVSLMVGVFAIAAYAIKHLFS